MRAAADKEDASEKGAISPGRILPARELLGDMLLESGRAEDALAAYEAALVTDPKRLRSFYGAGQAAAASSNADKARYYFGRLVEMADPDSTRPEIARARSYLAAK
jgi:tetratricopeptide (TPR) repeat protein